MLCHNMAQSNCTDVYNVRNHLLVFLVLLDRLGGRVAKLRKKLLRKQTPLKMASLYFQLSLALQKSPCWAPKPKKRFSDFLGEDLRWLLKK